MIAAVDDRPVTGGLSCGDYRPGRPPCSSTDGLVRLFVGWRCRAHTLPGAQVYASAPHLLADQPDTAPTAPLAARTLPDPGRAAASAHAQPSGAEAAAAALVMGRTGRPRRRLLDQFIAVGERGMTSTEAHRWYEATYGPIDLYTLRPRLTELKARDGGGVGWLVDSGRRRHPRGPAAAGAPAEEVLVLSRRALAQLAAQGVQVGG